MFYISDIYQSSPEIFQSELQKIVYETLVKIKIPFQRVETDVAITMEDCTQINQKLDMKMVKTLFLCDKKKTSFYLFITRGEKRFEAKKFSEKLGVGRLSFVSEDLFEIMLGTKIGAATVFSALIDKEQKIQIIFDKEVIENKWYGCSDSMNTGYMKIETEHILKILLPYANHKYQIIQM